MATLRTFQNEIEEIQHREVAKKLAQVLADRKDAPKEKDTKKSVGAAAAAAKGPAPAAEKGKAPDVAQGVAEDTDDVEANVADELRIQVNRHSPRSLHACAGGLTPCARLQTLLLSDTPEDRAEAADLVANLLTRCRGEFVFRIGARPLHAKLFTGEAIAEQDLSVGVKRTAEEVQTLRTRIAEAVDEVGGKVRVYSSYVLAMRVNVFCQCRHRLCMRRRDHYRT